MHFILLRNTSWHEMHAPSRIPLHLQSTWLELPLLADQNVKVVVGGMQPRVPLRPEWCSEDDQVLGDARVDDIHRAHCAAGVVEHPFGRVRVERDLRRWVGSGEVCDDVGYHARSVVWRGCNGCLRKFVDRGWVEDIPSVLLLEMRDTHSSVNGTWVISYASVP